MRPRALALALLVMSQLGCYRAMYINLQPHDAPPAVETSETLAKRTRYGWINYWLWGTLPSERVVDASEACGGDAHVASIETRQTAWQVSIGIAASIEYVLNIYTPWYGHVTCDHAPPPH